MSSRSLVVIVILMLILIKLLLLLSWLICVLPAIKSKLRLVDGLRGLLDGRHVHRLKNITVLDSVLMNHAALIHHVIGVNASVENK